MPPDPDPPTRVHVATGLYRCSGCGREHASAADALWCTAKGD